MPSRVPSAVSSDTMASTGGGGHRLLGHQGDVVAGVYESRVGRRRVAVPHVRLCPWPAARRQGHLGTQTVAVGVDMGD